MENKYKIIIFDLDDTIIENLESVKSAFKTMLKASASGYSEQDFNRWNLIDKKFWSDWQDGLIELPDEFKNETGKKSDDFLNWLRSQRVLKYFNNEISLKKAIELNDIYMQALTNVVIPVTGIEETLEYLSKKYYLVVATNGPTIATEEKLKKIDCLKYFSKIYAADMFGYMKPKKEFFHAIQKDLINTNNEEYIIIGDSLKSDAGFGINCGFDSCWYDRGTENLDSAFIPTYTIKKIEELKKILII